MDQILYIKHHSILANWCYQLALLLRYLHPNAQTLIGFCCCFHFQMFSKTEVCFSRLRWSLGYFLSFFRYYDFSNVTRLHYLFRAALVLIWILPLVSYIFLIVPAPAVCSSAFCNVSNTCLSGCERTPTDESLTITNYFRRGVHFAPFSPQRRARLLPCCFFFFFFAVQIILVFDSCFSAHPDCFTVLLVVQHIFFCLLAIQLNN